MNAAPALPLRGRFPGPLRFGYLEIRLRWVAVLATTRFLVGATSVAMDTCLDVRHRD